MSDLDAFVSAMQRVLYPLPVSPRSRLQLLRVAWWWQLEALRGYPSAERSREYAANLRNQAGRR